MRRLAAILYDLLLLAAVFLVAGIPLLLFTGGEAAPDKGPILSVYYFMVGFFFYGWFWTHGGQTLGMKTWHIRVQTYDGNGINWWQAALRYLSAVASLVMFGLGFIWSLFDRHSLTWHDRFSMSELVVVPKPKKK